MKNDEIDLEQSIFYLIMKNTNQYKKENINAMIY